MSETSKPMITVNVSRITDAIAIGAKGTQKRALIGTTDGDYPQTLEFEFFGKNVELLNDVRPGDIVEIKYDLRGREWTNPNTNKTSVFVSLSAFSLNNLMAVHAKAEAAQQETPAHHSFTPPAPANGGDEDLPF